MKKDAVTCLVGRVKFENKQLDVFGKDVLTNTIFIKMTKLSLKLLTPKSACVMV